jgi:hypothetical protein
MTQWKNSLKELPPINQIVLVITNYGKLHLGYYDGNNYADYPRFISYELGRIINKHDAEWDEYPTMWAEITSPDNINDLPGWLDACEVAELSKQAGASSVKIIYWESHPYCT